MSKSKDVKNHHADVQSDKPKIQEDQQDNMIETTEARRIHQTPAKKREIQAKLFLEISKLRCKHCNSLGTFMVFSTEGRARFLKCTTCKRTGHKIIV